MFILSCWSRIGVHVYCRTNRCVPGERLLSLAGRLLHHLLMDLNGGKILGTLECSLVLERHPLEIVFKFLDIRLGRVLVKILGSGSGSGQVGVLKYMIGYFWVSFLLSCISGYLFNLGYFRVFLGISG